MKAEKARTPGKKVLFSIFLFGSVLLIITIIATHLVGVTTNNNNYLRSTLALDTAPGLQETLQAVGTQVPGQGGGQGKGDHQNHQEGPTPTINFTTYPTEDDV